MEVRVVSGAVVVEIGVLARADVPGLVARAEEMVVREPGARLVCAVLPDCPADLVLVDVLARLRLLARRRGRAYQIRDAPPAVGDLLGLVGLRDAVPVADPAAEAHRPRAAPPGRGGNSHTDARHAQASPPSPAAEAHRPRAAPLRRGLDRCFEARWEAEEGEQVLGVQEGVQADDASA